MLWTKKSATLASKLTYKDADSDVAQSGLEVMAAGAAKEDISETAGRIEPKFVDSFLKQGGRLNALVNVNKKYPAVILHEEDIRR